MSLDRRATALFHDLLALPRENREAEARLRCDGDEALVARVLTLLAGHREWDPVNDYTTSFIVAPVAGLLHGGPGSPPQPTTASRPTPELIPERIGPFLIQAVLGRGGMGVVYRALNMQSRQVVALKTLVPGTLRDPGRLERFEQEVQIHGRISDPRIVKLNHAENYEGVPCLVMEFVDGKNLEALVEDRGPLPAELAVALALQVAEALQYLHSKMIVHRDVTSRNLMLAADGTLKMLDLGIARAIDPDLSHRNLTSSGQGLGTQRFASPQQMEDARNADAQDDIYSLGRVLHLLLTGEVPAGPGLASPTLPQGVRLIVEQMTAKGKDVRYKTAAAVAEAMAGWLEGARAAPLPASGELAGRGLPRVYSRFSLLLSLLLVIFATCAMLWLPQRSGVVTLGGIMDFTHIEYYDPKVRVILGAMAIVSSAVLLVGIIHKERHAIAWLFKWIVLPSSIVTLFVVAAWLLATPVHSKPTAPWTAALKAVDAQVRATKAGKVSHTRFVLAIPLAGTTADEVLAALRSALGSPKAVGGWTVLVPEGTDWRVAVIDLDAAGWAPRRWDALVRDDPYAISFANDNELRAVEERLRLEAVLGSTARPLVRADWLLARRLADKGGSGADPVRASYDRDLDLAAAAGELGVPLDALRQVSQSDQVTGDDSLGDFARGGTVPRERWAGGRGWLFQRAARELLRAVPVH